MVNLKGYRAELVQQSSLSKVPIHADEYHARHPDFGTLLANEHSFFHVLFPEFTGHSERELKPDLLASLRSQHYRLSDQKVIYLYKTNYRGKVTVSFIAGVSYKDYREKRIVQHEHYIPSKMNKIQEKTKVLETFTGFPMVCGVFPEELQKFLKGFAFVNPVQKISLKGVTHEVFALTQGETDFVVKSFKKVDHLYIADGHHRFEAYSNVIESIQDKPNLIEDFDHIPVAIYNMGEVDVLRFYRVVKNVCGSDEKSLSEFFKHVSDLFFVEEIFCTKLKGFLQKMMYAEPADEIFNPISTLQTAVMFEGFPTIEQISRELEPVSKNQFSMYVSSLKKWFLLTSRKPMNSMNLVFLHNQFLSKFVGEGRPGSIEYYPETQGNCLFMMRMAESEGSTNIVLHSHKVEAREILYASEHKEKLPPKSSLFYPKPLVGMIIRPLIVSDNKIKGEVPEGCMLIEI